MPAFTLSWYAATAAYLSASASGTPPENDRGEPPGEDTIRGLAALLETDEEMLLAMAGKVPAGLRDRARDDIEFARFLRRLPSIPDSEMREIYKKFGIPPADQRHTSRRRGLKHGRPACGSNTPSYPASTSNSCSMTSASGSSGSRFPTNPALSSSDS